MVLNRLALFSLFICFFVQVSGNDNATHQLLHDILFAHNHEYHSKLRPVKHNSETLILRFGIAINQIIKVDEYSQVLTTSVWMRLFWTDQILHWNPSDYNGTTQIYVPSTYLWKPDLVLYNNADKTLYSTAEESIAILYHTGEITYMFPARYESSCLMDFKYFPFDQQECYMKFGSWAYDGLHVDIKMLEDHPADITNFQYNSGWGLVAFEARRNIESYGCCPNVPFPDVTFNLKIRRRYLMQVFYLIIPNLLINITAVMSFMLPCDSSERCTLGITIYLSMVVYLLLIQELIPASDKIPVLVRYIVSTLVMVALSQVVSILVLRIHHNGTHDNDLQVPRWARRVIMHGLARVLCMHDLIVPDEEHNRKISSEFDKTALLEDGPVDADSEAEIEVKEESLNTLNTIDSEQSGIQQARKIFKAKTAKVLPAKKQGKQFSVSSITDNFLDRGPHKKRSSIKIVGCHESTTVIKRTDLKKNKELLLYKILKHCEELRELKAAEEKQKEVKYEWQQLAMLIDRFMFYVYVIMTSIVWIALFAAIPSRENDILI